MAEAYPKQQQFQTIHPRLYCRATFVNVALMQLSETTPPRQSASSRLCEGRFVEETWLHEGVALTRDALTSSLALSKRGTLASLQSEASLSLSLAAHPACRAVRWVERSDANLTLVVDHVEGTFLHEHRALKRRGLLTPEAMESIAVKLLRALYVLHTLGYAHGDLKPEHVLIDAANEVRLIDLGLATRLGSAPRGGTHGHLAPELLQGSALDIPAELYAFGTCFAQQPVTARLAKLVKACCAKARHARPPTVEAALTMLGALPTPRDRIAVRDHTGSATLRTCIDVLERAKGEVLFVQGDAGAGRTHLARGLEQHLFRTALEGAERYPLRIDAHGAALARLPSCMGVPAHEDRARRIERGARKAADQGVVFIVDGDAPASSDAEADLRTVAQAIRAHGRGAMVVIGNGTIEASQALSLPPWGASEVRVQAEHLGLRLLARDVSDLLTHTGGRAGSTCRLLEALVSRPETRLRDLLRDGTPKASTTPTTPRSPKERLDAARSALGEDAPREAIALVGEAQSDEERRLLRSAHGRVGALAEALSLAGAITKPDAHDVLARARLLERCGRFHEAIAAAQLLSAQGDHASERATILATSWLATGALDEAKKTLRHALRIPSSDRVTRIRLLTLMSDAELRSHQRAAALEAAAQAHALAETHGDDGLLALVLARLGALHGLGGQHDAALTSHRDALLHAERAGDVVALPPYLMNVATAHHALGEYADAIAMYERAAELAERLGRVASLAASLVNLAALHQTLRADEEAAQLLDRAETVARSATSGLHIAQVSLIRAELFLAEENFDAAITAADEATRAFEALSATRQALEASLVRTEIAVLSDEGDAPTRIDALDRKQLEDAGLLPRADLARIEWLLRKGDFTRARRLAEILAEQVQAAGPIEVHVRVLGILADVHNALSTGAFDVHDAAFRKRLGDLAAQTPEAFRARLVDRMSARRRTRPEPHKTRVLSNDRALGPVGERLIALIRRTLLENDEDRLLEAALDEAIHASGAERGFLLRRSPRARKGAAKTEVAIARNLDRDSIRNPRFRFSRSVADRVLETGEPLVTASATEDPALHGARSITFLGLRSILCVPVRAPSGVIGALYLDHRFERGRFDEEVLRTVEAFADVVGLSIENARLHRASEAKLRQLEEESAHAHEDAERLAALLATRDEMPGPHGGIVGESPAIRAAIELARKVARSDLPVLIAGESGTGKELFARFVHDASMRRERPFLAVNCGALPEALLESELFGHVRGAFTGAIREHPGLFRSAEGGTLFLDEVGEMPASMQVRLLRVLQEQEVRPVGGRTLIKINVRIVCATHRDLARAVEEGTFRQDLYFRLAGVRIDVPPLRERITDIPLLVRSILTRLDGGQKTLSRAALLTLLSHPFPGNVRELEQALRRGLALAEGEVIEPSDLGIGKPSTSRSHAPRTLVLAEVEPVLRALSGNRTLAAKKLGVSRATLHRFLAAHPTEVEGRRGRPRVRRG